jgi:hypothetical protein
VGSRGEDRVFSLTLNLWEEDKKVSPKENLSLEVNFTMEELDEVLLSMKPNSVLGPNKLPVLFFKCSWEILQGHILQLLNDHPREGGYYTTELWHHLANSQK